MKIGIIGGTGLYEMEGLKEVRSLELDTPFGKPSDPFMHGKMAEHEIFFLPRHGKGHRILPSELNHRTNIHAFKQLGVERIISVSAVGSLREDYRPRDVFLLDQYFDRTKGSLNHTFFGNGLAAHVAFGEPICSELRMLIFGIAQEVVNSIDEFKGIRVHNGGTYVNMEGPAFSTKAESRFYRMCDFDVIGMTSLPEAKLCREAEICYAAIAMITDYDCWHETAESVTVEMIIGHLQANAKLAKAILQKLIPAMTGDRKCGCGNALQSSIVTDRSTIPSATKEKLKAIVGKYL